MSITLKTSFDRRLEDACRYVRSITDSRPKIALILGSGLGNFADSVSATVSVRSSEIPNFPVGSVQGHAGKLLFGKIEESGRSSPPLLLFQGRVHYYETGDIEKVVFPISLAYELGVRSLIVTNAAGGINTHFKAGQLMLIRSYFNFARKYPSLMSTHKRQRTRSASLDSHLQDIIRQSARDMNINLQEGTYCWLHGPSYETAAEIKMLRTLGVDAVGMSTVPEIYRANHLGMKVAGISLISNLATGLTSGKLSHKEVTETADKAQQSFSALMKEIIIRIR